MRVLLGEHVKWLRASGRGHEKRLSTLQIGRKAEEEKHSSLSDLK